MRRIVSVSLGSSSRNKSATVEILGEQFRLERIGTDGSVSSACKLIAELDGKVDAIGLGGIDLYLVCGDRRWVIHDAARLARSARTTPVVDGSGLKDTLERRAIQMLHKDGVLASGRSPEDVRVLVVAAVDRFGMAEAFSELGYQCRFGDLVFALGMPLPVSSLGLIKIAATVFLPLFARLPFRILYPTGSRQEQHCMRGARHFEWADIIAGDFHFIRRNLPATGRPLEGKTVITNTTTEADIELLRSRGLYRLITTTPRVEGRSFGTNVMEAALVALTGKPADEVTRDDYLRLLERINWRPEVEILSI